MNIQVDGVGAVSAPLQIVLLLTLISFLPAILVTMTSFTRIAIVFHFLRQALGTQEMPSNQILIGLALFLTMFIMAPVGSRINELAVEPALAGKVSVSEALKRGTPPLREFMLKQTRQSDVQLFAKLAKLPPEVKSENVPFKVLVPAFVTSELKSAFQIGFLIFIPFLVIDMIVASVLMSLGMMMLSPVLVALPFKLMLFVLADGWNLLLGSLAASFVT
jgi:flagellar biosynthetic protein FliP